MTSSFSPPTTFSEGLGSFNIPLTSLISSLLTHFTLTTVRARLTTFFVNNTAPFVDFEIGEEYSNEAYSVFLEYEKLFAEELETFCNLHSINVETLIKTLHERYDDNNAAESKNEDIEEEEEKMIVQYLLAALDPKTFFSMAKKEAEMTLLAREDCEYF